MANPDEHLNSYLAGMYLWFEIPFVLTFCGNQVTAKTILSPIFLNTHLGYPLDFIFVFHCHVMGGIPPPSRGIWVKTGVPGMVKSEFLSTTASLKYSIIQCYQQPTRVYLLNNAIMT